MNDVDGSENGSANAGDASPRAYRQYRIDRRNRLFDEWAGRNPGKGFGDYYGEIIAEHLDQGLPHPTLGGNLIEGREFGVSGRAMLDRFIGHGLKPTHVFVDYGCGTLRIGCHFIDYLERGNYWGFDVFERFLAEGRKLLGDQMMREKSPHLEVIDDAAIARARSAAPDFLLSKSVLLHVHPDELTAHIQRISGLIGNNTLAVIDGVVSEALVQFEPLSWSYPRRQLEDEFGAHGCTVRFVEEQPTTLDVSDQPAARMVMEVTRS